MERQAEVKIALLVVRGSRSGERVWVRHGQHLIGSNENSDLHLSGDGVSDLHAVVIRSSDSVTIANANSANLTWVNGRRLTSPHKLSSKDEICIGSTTLRYEESRSSCSKRAVPPVRPVPKALPRPPTMHVVLSDAVSILAIVAAFVTVLAFAFAFVTHTDTDVATDSAVLPIDKGSYETTAEFGDIGGRWRKRHTGLDFAAPEGTEIHAVTAGTVVYAQASGGAYGNFTKIRSSDGTETWYAHQSRISVLVDETVTIGQVIGAVGATGNVTGPHVHLEVRISGSPTDPRSWLTTHGVNP